MIATSVNVVCLKWGTKYSSEYVNRLYSMVQKRLALPHRFVCVADSAAGVESHIETKPIEHPELRGWWHKLTLFKRKFYDLSGITLFLDLDVVIIDDLDCFFLHQGEFCICDDLGRGIYNSSVFRLEIGSYPEVWDRFSRDHERITERYEGDQEWISETIPHPTAWPRDWVVSLRSYYDSHPNEMGALEPPKAHIIMFHGSPKPHELLHGPACGYHAPWVDHYWR